MFLHRKKPLFPVKVDEVDPVFAQKLLEQFGGASGEFTAMTEYFVQSFSCDDHPVRDMLLDIAVEEISHLEMVGLMVEQLLKGAEKEKVFGDTLFQVRGQGPHFLDSLGNAWTANYIRASGDMIADMKHNISAEAGAKMAYERLIGATADKGCQETLRYLMTREISHQKMFMKALADLQEKKKSLFSGALEAGPDEDTYYDLSTGDRDMGIGQDARGPWNQNGWNYLTDPGDKLNNEVKGPKSGFFS